MCELLGMSANVPTDLRFSFAGLIRRAGDTGRHTDGFGVAFHDGDGCRVFHDPAPGAQSPLAAFLRVEPIRSRIAVAHIRRGDRVAIVATGGGMARADRTVGADPMLRYLALVEPVAPAESRLREATLSTAPRRTEGRPSVRASHAPAGTTR